jgi:hypothetical protein
VFWLNAVIRQRIVLPLPKHLALDSFTPEQLGCAAQKAVLRDQNLAKDYVKLHSYTKISLNDEAYSSVGVSKMAFVRDDELVLMDPNGAWLFLFSTDHMMRVISSRTGKLVYIDKRGGFGWIERRFMEESTCGTFAVDFRGDSEAIFVEIYTST